MTNPLTRAILEPLGHDSLVDLVLAMSQELDRVSDLAASYSRSNRALEAEKVGMEDHAERGWAEAFRLQRVLADAGVKDPDSVPPLGVSQAQVDRSRWSGILGERGTLTALEEAAARRMLQRLPEATWLTGSEPIQEPTLRDTDPKLVLELQGLSDKYGALGILTVARSLWPDAWDVATLPPAGAEHAPQDGPQEAHAGEAGDDGAQGEDNPTPAEGLSRSEVPQNENDSQSRLYAVRDGQLCPVRRRYQETADDGLGGVWVESRWEHGAGLYFPEDQDTRAPHRLEWIVSQWGPVTELDPIPMEDD